MDRISKFLNKLSQKERTVVKDVLEKIKKGEMANLDMKKFVSDSLEESKKFAKDFAGKILARKSAENNALVLALVGDLGSGKTAFVQAFAEALGVKEKIKSPTFIIFRKSKIPVSSAGKGKKERRKNGFENFYHFDVYRIHNEKEILNLGWEEIISNPENIVLVEWADKIEKILPKNSVRIMFKHLKGDKREIIFS